VCYKYIMYGTKGFNIFNLYSGIFCYANITGLIETHKKTHIFQFESQNKEIFSVCPGARDTLNWINFFLTLCHNQMSKIEM